MARPRRRSHASGIPDTPDAPDPPYASDPPDDPSLLGLFSKAIEDTPRTIRLIAIMIVVFAGIVVVLEAAKGVHLHWPSFVTPTLRLPTLTAAGGSMLTLTVIGIRKAISGPEARKASAPSAEGQTSTSSSPQSSGQHQQQPKSPQLRNTRRQSGRYRLQSG
jgi:hypothetical protein